VLHRRTRLPAAPKLTILLALVLVAAIPAAADAKNYKVDGRVKGAPTVRGKAVTVNFQLTSVVGRKLKLGTRAVRVSLKRRARLPLSGSAAQAARVAASKLQVGDRVKGVTSLSRKARKRMRYVPRPTLKVKRARVIRNVRRLAPGGGGGGGPVAAPRTLEQVLAELPGRVAGLNAKVGEFGSLPQQIEAQKLHLESLATGVDNVTTAFETLTGNLEGRADSAAFEGVVLQVEGLVARIEALESSSSSVETALGALESGIGTIGGALQELTTIAPLLASQASLIRSFPGAEAQVMALDETLRRIESRIGAAEGAIGQIASTVNGLNAQMAQLANAVNAVASTAGSADLGTVQAGVNGLAGGVANLESAFGALASLNGAATEIAGLEADAVALEGMVEALCTSVPTACP
jgi:prefoldin subunit 5